jgi:hypothetical protein
MDESAATRTVVLGFSIGIFVDPFTWAGLQCSEPVQPPLPAICEPTIKSR